MLLFFFFPLSFQKWPKFEEISSTTKRFLLQRDRQSGGCLEATPCPQWKVWSGNLTTSRGPKVLSFRAAKRRGLLDPKQPPDSVSCRSSLILSFPLFGYHQFSPWGLSPSTPPDKHLFYKTNEKERTVTSCFQVFWGFVFLLFFFFVLLVIE